MQCHSSFCFLDLGFRHSSPFFFAHAEHESNPPDSKCCRCVVNVPCFRRRLNSEAAMEPDESPLGEQSHDLPTVDMDVDLSAFDMHALQLKAIEDYVQNPPEGVFGLRDLKWELEYCPPRGEHKKAHLVQQCYVPSCRVQDFIEGMQCGREGTQCRFRPNKENRKPNQSIDGPRTAMNFVR